MIKLTVKQSEILFCLKRLTEPDVYELMEELSHKPKRDALRHSLKVLIDEGLVETLRKTSERNVRFTLTPEGAKYS